MNRFSRNLNLTLFDFSGNQLCSLYDATQDIEGQAANINIVTDRTGYKELTFTLPCADGNQEEPNYRVELIKADYRIRAITDEGEDWYILNQPRIVHANRSKVMSVSAGHVCEILKYRQLDLEFADDLGNNVGTAKQLLTTVLDGTEWSVGDVDIFMEKDGSKEKYRTLKCSTKTGALKMIQNICDLFEAKAVYHGDTKTVDLKHLNPFTDSIDPITHMPNLDEAAGVLEIHYGINMPSLTRTLKSDAMVTKMYAYGAHGDTTVGYCGIEELDHKVYRHTAERSFTAGDHVYLNAINPFTGAPETFTFEITHAISTGDTLLFSTHDNCSMCYIYNESKGTANPRVYDYEGSSYFIDDMAAEDEQNWYSFLMDFNYYFENGGISDEALQAVAKYQRDGLQLKENIYNATQDYNADAQSLFALAASNNFVKLNVTSRLTTASYAKLVVSKTDDYPDGVIYRTDYDVPERRRFKWRVATKIKDNGEPLNTEASVIYWYHYNNDGSQLKQVYKTYIKEFDDPEESGSTYTLTLWMDPMTEDITHDHFFLLSSNSISGKLGVLESADGAAVESLVDPLKTVSIVHPVYCEVGDAPTKSISDFMEYAWDVAHDANWDTMKIYFCYKEQGDAGWNLCGIGRQLPSSGSEVYYYIYSAGLLYRKVSGVWQLVYDQNASYSEDWLEKKKVAQSFGVVWRIMRDRWKYNRGYYEYYTHTGTVAPGNYYYEDEYGNFVMFTLPVSSSKQQYDTNTGWLYMDDAEIGSEKSVNTKLAAFDSVNYHPSNIMDNVLWEDGTINNAGGDEEADDKMRTNFKPVYEKTTYKLDYGYSINISYYTNKNVYISRAAVSANSEFTTPTSAYYIRISTDKREDKNVIISAKGRDNIIIYPEEDKQYVKLDSWIPSGENKGYYNLLKKFLEYSDKIYLQDLPAIQDAQAQFANLEKDLIGEMGDMYKESTFSKTDYVQGDEAKLLNDAYDTLKQMAKPEAVYDVNWLDLYHSDTDDPYYPDITTDYAVHLVDQEIKVNCWAYINKLTKCYDKPWETKLQIDTNLTTMAGHSFTDVLSKVAEVSQKVEANEDIYARAAMLNEGGISADFLSDAIDTAKVAINGAHSSWRTDDKGNLIFEDTTGTGAMTLTGNGFAIADTKDEWGDYEWKTFGTAKGFSADLINAGTIKAKLIQAGSITANKLASDVGQELDISSNKALNLFATVSGSRPAGSVNVKRNGESVIKLTPDGIDIVSGGYINIDSTDTTIKGTTVSVESDSVLGIKAGSQIDITSGADININGGSLNVNSEGKINVNSDGGIEVASGGAIEVRNGTGSTANALLMNEDGLTVNGAEIKLLTNSATEGKITLGSDSNYITSNGYVSLADGGIVLDGDNSKITVDNGTKLSILNDSDIEIKAGSDVKIEGANVNVGSGANMNIDAGGKIKITSAGSFSLDSQYFDVAEDGKITATGGEIGGWSIGTNELSSGSGTTKVALNSDPDTDYAFWAGHDDDDLAPFRVKRDGTVVINALERNKDGDPAHGTEKIDLRTSLTK